MKRRYILDMTSEITRRLSFSHYKKLIVLFFSKFLLRYSSHIIP